MYKLINFKIKILQNNKNMPRYIIKQQPLQSQIKNQQYRPKKSTNLQQGVFLQSLRQVLQNNRKSNHYVSSHNQLPQDNYNNYSYNLRPNRHQRYISQAQNPNIKQYYIQKQADQQDVVYVIQKRENQGQTVKLPKIKRRNKNFKYNNIDQDEKLIIKNYMNAKLIQFKNPIKKSSPVIKRRVHTLDNVRQIPEYLKRKNNKYQTPIENLSKYVLAEQYPQQKHSKDFQSSSQYLEDLAKVNQINKSKNNVENIKRRSLANYQTEFSQRNNIKQNKNQKQQNWQEFNPLNLQTYFVKLRKINNISEQNVKTQRAKIKLPSIPSRQQMSNFIKNYIPEYDQIKIQELIKSDQFQIIKDQDANYKSFYFGQTRDDKKYGLGILITDNMVFEGVWMDDMRVKGIQITQLGKYKGDFNNNFRTGKGQFFWAHGQYYSGEWKNGKKNGSGYWRSTKGQSYMGQWKNGQVIGYGVHTMKSGQKYEGQFVNFLKHGYGKQAFPNRDVYEGRYIQGQPHGNGKYQWKNGTIYQGQFFEGLRQGKGTIIYPNKMKFEGNFKTESIQGIGRLQYSNGDVFNGIFSNNMKNGHGILDLKSQKIIIKGIWLNNELIQQQ